MPVTWRRYAILEALALIAYDHSAWSSPTRMLTFISRTSTMPFVYWRVFAAILLAFSPTLTANAQEGPKDSVLLIIRHAENPANGHGLSPRGEERAKAYASYFQKFTVDSKQLEPQAVVVAADSKHSHRPRLTVQPFAKAANLPIDDRFANKQPADLAAELRANYQGKVILVCWHHGQIPALLRALGAAPETLLPNGKWPKDVYDWVIMVSFDKNGHVIPDGTKRISEHLLQGDSQ